jgi:hypothetical protein
MIPITINCELSIMTPKRIMLRFLTLCIILSSFASCSIFKNKCQTCPSFSLQRKDEGKLFSSQKDISDFQDSPYQINSCVSEIATLRSLKSF